LLPPPVESEPPLVALELEVDFDASEDFEGVEVSEPFDVDVLLESVDLLESPDELAVAAAVLDFPERLSVL